MKLSELRYTRETAPHLEEIRRLSARSPWGAAVFTASYLLPENENGAMWAGLDEYGRLSAVVFQDGRSRTWLTEKGGAVSLPPPGIEAADFFMPPKRRERLSLMALSSLPAVPCPGPEETTAAVWDTLAMICGDAPGAEAEKRAVLFLRAAAAGRAAAFTLRDESGRVEAAAQLLAANERYALIGNVYTRKDCRQKGDATRLIAACGAYAVRKGLTPVLYCERNMRRFYAARGYREVRYHGM